MLKKLPDHFKASGIEIDNLDEELSTATNNYNDYIQRKNESRVFMKEVQNAYEGEKPSAYFCSREKNFSAQKYISRLKVMKNGVEVVIKDQNEIGNETQQFYKDLFSNKDDPDKVGDIGSFLNEGETNYPKLTDAEAEEIEGHITAEELLRTLKNTKNDTAPGSSGFTYSFYKTFWINLKTFMLKMANYSFDIGMLPASQRLGVISLLPKGDKPKDYKT